MVQDSDFGHSVYGQKLVQLKSAEVLHLIIESWGHGLQPFLSSEVIPSCFFQVFYSYRLTGAKTAI